MFGTDEFFFVRSSASKPIPAVSLSFESPSAGFSGLRIAGLKVTGEDYSIFKGVRLRGVGDVEVRCIN
jgi:AP-3 complex subunit mu